MNPPMDPDMRIDFLGLLDCLWTIWSPYGPPLGPPKAYGRAVEEGEVNIAWQRFTIIQLNWRTKS